MNLSITKQCEYCHQEFTTTNNRKKYCNKTCRNYASEVRMGRREGIPAPDHGHRPLSESEKEQLLEQLEPLNEEVKALEERYKKEEEEKCMPLEIYWDGQDELLIQILRAQEKRYDHYRKLIAKNSSLKGEQILKTIHYQPTYPFRDLNNSLLYLIGRPKLPFVANIVGEEGTGKTILAVALCVELLRMLDTKILYIADTENEADVLRYLQRSSVPLDSLAFCKAETIQDLEKALAEDIYEFVFIDAVTSLRFNAANIKKLRPAYPKLSLFCISRSEEQSLKKIASIHIDTYLKHSPFPDVWVMALADITGKAVPFMEDVEYDEERDVEITIQSIPQVQVFNKSKNMGFQIIC